MDSFESVMDSECAGQQRSKLAVNSEDGSKTSGTDTPVLSRNPYLNFLREFRKANPDISVVEQVRRGAKAWRDLTSDTKLAYVEAAHNAPQKPQKKRIAKSISTLDTRKNPKLKQSCRRQKTKKMKTPKRKPAKCTRCRKK